MAPIIVEQKLSCGRTVMISWFRWRCMQRLITVGQSASSRSAAADALCPRRAFSALVRGSRRKGAALPPGARWKRSSPPHRDLRSGSRCCRRVSVRRRAPTGDMVSNVRRQGLYS
jgi:hypothetical protein